MSTKWPFKPNPASSFPVGAYTIVICCLVVAVSMLLFISAYSLYTGVTLVKQPRLLRPAVQQTIPASPEAQQDPLGVLMVQLQSQPDNTVLLMDIGEILITRKRFEQAKMFLQKATITEPSNVAARLLLGQSQFLLDENDEAAATFTAILELDPSNVPAMINLGIIYKFYLQRPEEAQKFFEQVLATPGAEQRWVEKAREQMNLPNP